MQYFVVEGSWLLVVCARANTYLPTYQHKLVTRNPGDLSGGRGASLPFLPPLSSPGYRVTSKYWMIVGVWEGRRSFAPFLPKPLHVLGPVFDL